jgi:hypothetical protein
VHGFQAECDRQHRLADAGRADQQGVGLLLDEAQGRELLNEPTVEVWLG